MKIWIDVCHIPQYNFFKQLVLQLVALGHKVVLTVMDRGRTIRIVKKELQGINGVAIVPMGRHRMTRWSAIFEANIMRMARLFFWVPCQHFDVAISTNIFTSLFGKIYHIPNFSFGDDPQVYDLKYNCRWANKAHQCIYEWTMPIPMPNHLYILPCLKEWAYLAPNVFKHNIEALSEYGVQSKQYLFLREVSVGTVNYAEQKSGAILGIVDIIREQQHLHPELKVLLSLEEKYRRAEYPADWILLQEPIKDIHSLIYYSAGLISSGDSMAREAALLGVPAYYLGIRYDMPANAAAANVAQLQNQKTQPIADWLHNTLSIAPQAAELHQQQLRKHIDKEFIDINKYMLRLVESVADSTCAKNAQVGLKE